MAGEPPTVWEKDRSRRDDPLAVDDLIRLDRRYTAPLALHTLAKHIAVLEACGRAMAPARSMR